MTSVKFTIPGRLPGMNEYQAACRRHRMAGAAMKKTAMEQCMWQMIAEKRKGTYFECCDIEIKFVEKDRRRDKDNISGFGGKVILDALQKMGIIPNDGWLQVNNLRYSWDVDKVNPRIEVTLTEVLDNAAD